MGSWVQLNTNPFQLNNKVILISCKMINTMLDRDIKNYIVKIKDIIQFQIKFSHTMVNKLGETMKGAKK